MGIRAGGAELGLEGEILESLKTSGEAGAGESAQTACPET